MDLLPAKEARFGAVYYAGPADARLAALADTLLRDAEVQYVARHARPTVVTVGPDRGCRRRGRLWQAISEH